MMFETLNHSEGNEATIHKLAVAWSPHLFDKAVTVEARKKGNRNSTALPHFISLLFLSRYEEFVDAYLTEFYIRRIQQYEYDLRNESYVGDGDGDIQQSLAEACARTLITMMTNTDNTDNTDNKDEYFVAAAGKMITPRSAKLIPFTLLLKNISAESLMLYPDDKILDDIFWKYNHNNDL